MEELDLKDLFEIFWNKKLSIILIVLIFVVIGIIYTVGFVTPEYSASTTILLVGTTSADSDETNTNTITTSDLSINSQLVETYSALVKSDNIIRQVIENLDIDVDADDLKGNISVSSVEDTELIKITVTDLNPTYAANIANEIASVFEEKIAKEIYGISNVHIIDEAEVPTSPSNINNVRDVAVAGFIGVVVAVIYVLLGNMLDTTVKTAAEIEKEVKIPVLATIPIYNMEMEKLKGKRGNRK